MSPRTLSGASITESLFLAVLTLADGKSHSLVRFTGRELRAHHQREQLAEMPVPDSIKKALTPYIYAVSRVCIGRPAIDPVGRLFAAAGDDYAVLVGIVHERYHVIIRKLVPGFA